MDTIYHYCSNDTFLKIITGNSIHLSSLSISNDRMEGKLIIDLMAEWASRNISSESKRHDFMTQVDRINNHYDGLGFCLSMEGDLLSQWRGYADDGKGISIGFSKKYLELIAKKHLPGIFPEVSLYEVKYDGRQQFELLQPISEKMKDRIDRGALDGEGLHLIPGTDNTTGATDGDAGCPFEDLLLDLFDDMHSLAQVMFAMKKDGFSEENEWRLIAPYRIVERISECSFRMGKYGVVPYREVELCKDNNGRRINEVIVGPKNPTPKYVIEGVLKANGFVNTDVKVSGLSYR